ncbi:hypothetical protein [Micromonospora gifhornensis]|uniref:hypothetical protein n=1 Tax=Micromonospora gifhornensis TaxID=84594 RepID=UPI0036523E83
MTNPPPGYPPQPPYGGQPPATPRAPYHGAPPPQVPMVARIPEDQPFVVRPNLVKRGLLFGSITPLLVAPLATCASLGILDSTDPDLRENAALSILGLVGCLLALSAVPIGIQLWLFGRAPVLALSPAGLWIRTRPTRGQAVWLPWEAIAQISRRRWLFEKMLVVKPYDPRILPKAGFYTALDSAALSALHGSGLVATLNFADKSEAEILAAVAHFSANRCHLT